MNKINLTINNIPITAFSGQTILEVAKANDIFIPTLCHDERVKPFGSCLICRIEVEGARGNMLACATPVTEGMIVRTESDGISSARKMCLELLVSQHYGDCIAPCSLACPAQIDVQAYIAHIANGQYQEAIKVIKEKNPLPVVCGRVCTRPCEDECRRNIVDERVGIDYMKRFASDFDLNSKAPVRPITMAKTGKKVAIIGAGPSGLSCAYYLSIFGHSVTIFEKWPKAGGMLRYGIPEYRLPRKALDGEIKLIEDLGVDIKYNKVFGKDITYPELKVSGYEALFLGVGAQLGQPLNLPNENLEGVMTGIEFLGKVNTAGNIDFTGKKIIVIGGGNTALDAARTALRLNAAQVTLAYRRSKAEMPAHCLEIEEAEIEGVKLILLVQPKEIMISDNVVNGIKFIRMSLGSPDTSGRRKPEEVTGSEFVTEADIIIGAVGQTQDLSFLNSDLAIETGRGRVIVNKDFMTTNIEGVFAGGDVVTGPDSAIAAIAAGRRAAYSIDQFIKGMKVENLNERYNHVKGKLSEINPIEFEAFEKIPKEKMPLLNKEERKNNFKEVELGYSEEQVRKEAKRCLSCGCKDVHECKLREYTTIYEVHQERFKGKLETHPIDETHEFISRDPNKCIMCGLCVRICSEQQGAGVLGFVSRGYNTIITPSFEMPFGEDTRCENCGQCISTCPVGALTEKPKLIKPGPFKEEVTQSICTGCGTGCTVLQHTAGATLVRTTSKAGLGINNGNLCEKGRFGSYKYADKKRVEQPYIRRNGKLEPVDYNTAFEFIYEKLNIIGSESGYETIGVFASPDMTNEELFLAKELALVAANSHELNSLVTSPASTALQSSIGRPYGKATYENIINSDFIICIGFDIKDNNPVAALIVKTAAENGSKLCILHNKKTKLAKYSTMNYICDKEEASKLLTDTKGLLYENISKANSPLLIVNDNTPYDLVIAGVRLFKESKANSENILLMHNNCNTRGLLSIGADIKEPQINGLKAVISFNENENNYLRHVPFKVVCTPYTPDTEMEVDVLIPFEGFTEKKGTYTNSEGRIQPANRAINNVSLMKNCEVIQNIINKFTSGDI
jgi:formate dehydrogenase major subunit